MKLRRILLTTCFLATITLAASASASATTNCVFTTAKKVLTLTASCTTDTAILVPNGMTLDGNGFTITGIDPAGDHFKGAVVMNGGGTGSVRNLTVTVSGLANVCDAGTNRLRGIMFAGASGSIENNQVLNINQGPSGCQEGNAIEIRNFGDNSETSRVSVTNNTVTGYQKTGIIANGDVEVVMTGNFLDGLGPVNYIARNGIQFGFGGTGSARDNTVAGNSYSGASTVSGGILVVGGPVYGGNFSTDVQIIRNTLTGNDVGVYISQFEADFSAPLTATNIKVVNNVITHNLVTNGYVYQAGVSDVGNNDKIINNTISGAGYDPTTIPGSTFDVDADLSFTNRPKVHANR